MSLVLFAQSYLTPIYDVDNVVGHVVVFIFVHFNYYQKPKSSAMFNLTACRVACFVSPFSYRWYRTEKFHKFYNSENIEPMNINYPNTDANATAVISLTNVEK